MTWVWSWWVDFAQLVGLPELYRQDFVARAVVAILLLAPLLGGLSHLVVARRLAFFSSTLGQGSLTGLTIGIAMGQPLDDAFAPILGFCLFLAVLMVFVRRNAALPPDTVIGVFMSFTLGLGICLLVAATRQFNIHQIEGVMFGSALTVRDSDFLPLLALGAAVIVAVALAYNTLLADSLSPALARATGVSATIVDYGFVIVLTIAISLALKIIGALLVEAMVIVPAAAARGLARSTRSYLIASVVIAAVSGLAGLAVSIAWQVPSGGTIVLALCACFFVIAPIGAWRRRRG